MIIKTPSRIHITLIDLNASIGRVDGGIGLALEKPFMEIHAKEHDEIIVEGPFKERGGEVARKVLSTLNIEGGIEIEIREWYEPHIGLGSGTQLALGVGSAVCKVYGRELGVRAIARIAGRGGTSGIGTAAFEFGGLILDGGHSIKEKKEFLPSSASRAPPPPILARYDFPDWKVVLVVPKIRRAIHGREEVSIFEEFCPIDIKEVQRLSHVILMKILPSVIEEDIVTFGQGINEIQGIGFKKVEVEMQPKKIREIMNICRECSYGTGLSSFGPSIYSIVEDEGEMFNALKEKEDEVKDIIITKANNFGSKSNTG